MHWDKLTHDEINNRIQQAIGENINYRDTPLLGIPGSFLDEEEFYPEAPFLEDSPFLATFVNNPNHIGCHTVTKEKSEPFFRGTQKLELEVIKICAEEILKGEEDQQDGYIAPGGTEANLQAIWLYRNYFQKEYNATIDEIALVYSEDSHYSMPKAANVLGLNQYVIAVDFESRQIDLADLDQQIKAAQTKGVKYFIVIQNMATTMFGSVDQIDRVTNYLVEENINFKLHIDGAFGGFIYPFTNPKNPLNFTNKHISSFTLDGHKMLQTPYGTGIFLIRKGYMQYGLTDEAKYVSGKDYTICGSRSGANAISIWMTLMTHGSMGWTVKMEHLLDKTASVCSKLDKLGIEYFREPKVNLITIKAPYISTQLARKYNLIPNTSDEQPQWWKIVVMQHVKKGVLQQFLNELQAERSLINGI
ncbi:MAG: pyridoxal-dependent decarboxylase [Flavobacteriales bacterium]|jgi:glutamate/tyrosine decarboxylase-like PLP-dependent enzyme|nr:pyridoxal-dependent decarboxylase [Flavobacteriales bacterium]